jgi:hypothetical protein
MQLETFGLALSLAVLPMTALAQSAAPGAAADATKQEAREKMRAACSDDVRKFCANVERARGAMRICLDSNEKQLSATCKAARLERAAARVKDKS